MSLDWEKFRDILENTKDNVTRILQHSPFIIEFLSRLQKSLKELDTSKACFEKYPRAGSTLTLASLHPYIGYDPAIATVLISCLLEYSKLQLDQVAGSKMPEKNAEWCINRIRRFIHASRLEQQNSNTLIHKITELIQQKRQSLDDDTITRLLDKCLGLVNSREASDVIAELVSMALPDSVIDTMHFDPPRLLIPDAFIAKLGDPANDTLRRFYLNWPDDLKIKLYINYEHLYEIEILDFLEKYTQQQTRYSSLHDLRNIVGDDPLIQLANKSVYLADMLFDKLSHYAVYYGDWRIVRLIQCLPHNLTTSFKDTFHNFILYMPSQSQPPPYNAYLTRLTEYIYSGDLDSIAQRRNNAWCLTLAAHRFVFHCVYLLIEWCTLSQPWSSQIDTLVRYINWIIHPSLDQRESDSLSDLECWLQTMKDQTSFLLQPWRRLLNDNAMVLSCFLICIFYFSDTISMDEKLSMVERILREPGSRYNSYILLDYLEDIKSYRDCYPLTSDIDIPRIIQTVHNII